MGDASLVGYSFNGHIYFDKVLSVGLKSSAFIAQHVTNAVTYMCQMSHVSTENYLDDLVGPDTPDKALKSFYELGNILEFGGLEETLEKSCPPSTQMIFTF